MRPPSLLQDLAWNMNVVPDSGASTFPTPIDVKTGEMGAGPAHWAHWLQRRKFDVGGVFQDTYRGRNTFTDPALPQHLGIYVQWPQLGGGRGENANRKASPWLLFAPGREVALLDPNAKHTFQVSQIGVKSAS